MELYTSLACQFPQQVLAIFIRDVTTPLPRAAQPTSKQASLESLTSTMSLTAGKSSKSDRPGQLHRRRSDLEQQNLMEKLAKTDRPTGPIPASKTSLDAESPDELDDADEFSPNNPLDRNLPSSGVLSPYDSEGYTEVERRVVSLFRDRVHRARSQLPQGVTLHIFRTGDTCVDASLQLSGLAEHDSIES